MPWAAVVSAVVKSTEAPKQWKRFAVAGNPKPKVGLLAFDA